MVKNGHLRRLFALAAFLGVVFVGLAARLVDLQVWQHEKYRALAERINKRVYFREPRRGDILDANGNPLATSLPVKRVCADPSLMGRHHADVARAIAPLLEYERTELTRLLYPWRTNSDGTVTVRKYVDLKRKLSVEQWQQVTQAMSAIAFKFEDRKPSKVEQRFYRTLRQNAVFTVDDQHRVYPSGRLAAHVLGFAQEIEGEFNELSVHELRGIDGIERWFDTQLAGMRGWRITETDGRKREIVINREQDVDARPGLNVVLTIDMVIQNILESELSVAVERFGPKSASGLVIRPRTGEILAMAVLPNFDPNEPGKSPQDSRRNRIISDVYEPGSTFKIVTISAALHDGVVRLTDVIDCESGLWHYAGKPLHDHGHYDALTVENVITKSSNIGTAKIGLMLGEKRLYEHLRSFGFDARTGITLTGEVPGILDDVEAWDKLKITRIPIGQGIAVTHLQMAMAMCAIANNGRLMQPLLVTRLETFNGETFAQYHPRMVRRVVNERAARETVGALKTVVTMDGTAAKARLEHYSVAGKTGTAQKPGVGGYTGEYVASFIGFFPADAPEVCISIMFDEPDASRGYYGGQTAAPTFRQVAEKVANYLKIRPDRDEGLNESMARTRGGGRVRTAAVEKP
ncbi:MAG: penicillin-binding protein 2 [Verrucomicrobia subdivision 3 bacterium]|nr:penicillin-binding protein 2 [Limisphaerales bacterium]